MRFASSESKKRERKQRRVAFSELTGIDNEHEHDWERVRGA